MTTRNFDDALKLLHGGRVLKVREVHRRAVVERGLEKRAPFHRQRNSVADALLMELYAGEITVADLAMEPHAFVTSNSNDFSAPGSDQRAPHEDFAEFFSDEGSCYALGVDGLVDVLRAYCGEDFEELLAESDFEEEPRRLGEIIAAERELFDRI